MLRFAGSPTTATTRPPRKGPTRRHRRPRSSRGAARYRMLSSADAALAPCAIGCCRPDRWAGVEDRPSDERIVTSAAHRTVACDRSRRERFIVKCPAEREASVPELERERGGNSIDARTPPERAYLMLDGMMIAGALATPVGLIAVIAISSGSAVPNALAVRRPSPAGRTLVVHFPSRPRV